MAEARANGFSLTYGLPFTGDDATPRIYFQPIALILGLLMRVTKWDPGYVYVGYWLVASITMFRIAVALSTHYMARPDDAAGWLATLVLLWGGGVLGITGWLFYWLTAEHPELGGLWGALVSFDPGLGWWFLNLGRNTIYATEALYHTLFFATVILVIRRKFGAAILLMILTSFSHPFTGIQLILVIGFFSVLDQLMRRPDAPPLWFTFTVGVVLVAHLGHYLALLNLLSIENRIVHQQNSMSWTLPASSLLPAYGPMLLLAATRLFRKKYGPRPLSDPAVRLALAWFAVSLALANHEIVLAPRQPIHFTRGYIWTPLALLALPVIRAAFHWAINLRPRIVAVAMSIMFLGIAVGDNGMWFVRQYAYYLAQLNSGVRLSNEERAALNRLSEPDMAGRLLLSNNGKLGYLATAYTPLRPWMSHEFLTPDANLRKAELEEFYATAVEVAQWRHRPLVVLVDLHPDATALKKMQAGWVVDFPVADDFIKTMESADFVLVGSIGNIRVMTRDAR